MSLKKWNDFVVLLFVFLIKVYKQCISPALGSRCRFYPSCSQYSLEVFQKYGALKGFGKTTVRICKCHPFHRGGVDLP
ncbi:membrane protein insertion efficiency factor YidD [Silvanigrella paludirubra]|uniref:Putative membrane protein insertion efficiency factor n=1 Tax=Silvanigrella paludirubra TaxID=2499159 RepID=A0A6N6VW26_9BACT|nr:membrane protein insertion efficiency factor YidD [Silvanigrella paludirubra]KAB8040521.1 membrane protein insertion efficiency factor YidD [Silvanigrella paludirubra]